MTSQPSRAISPENGSDRDGELFRGHPWPAICLPRFYFFTLLVLLAAAAAKFAGVPHRFLLPAYTVAMSCICLAMLYRLLVISRTQVIINNERIEVHSGLWNRGAMSVELFHVISVRSYEPLWQRLFNVGTVIVVTTELPRPLVLGGMAAPDHLRDDLNMARLARRAAVGVREVNVGSITGG